MMRARTKAGVSTAALSMLAGAAALLATWSVACSNTGRTFQPITYGAKPWMPPDDWDPEPACVTGYFIAITNCTGCTGISYALCDGDVFDQCVCGGNVWPGAMCPQQLACMTNDFPPYNWMEFTDYTGPGWAGLELGAGASNGNGAGNGTTGTNGADGGAID